MKLSLHALAMVSMCCLATACAAPTAADDEGGEGEEAVASTEDGLTVRGSFVSRGTAYYPDASPLEGGFVDRRGAKLRTLQQFLAGEATYVSVAMDTTAFAYGQKLRIKELDAKYGRSIEFRVVDTGGAFRGKGRSRIDVCVKNRTASFDATINGTLHIDILGP